MPSSCVLGLIKIASWFKYQQYDIYHLGIKECTGFNRQNTLRFLFLWKQASERRAAQNKLFVNIRYVKCIMWNISCELGEFIFDVNLCLDMNLHLYLVNCYLYCTVCHYASCCIVGGHNSHSWFRSNYVSLIIVTILCIGIAY